MIGALAQLALQAQPVTYVDVLNNALNVGQTIALAYLAVRAKGNKDSGGRG